MSPVKKIVGALLVLSVATLALAQTFNPNNLSPNLCLSGGNLVATECPVFTFTQMGSQASSVYPWAQYPPGVTYNGGIPARSTQCGATVTPRRSGLDDTPNIQAAINACTAGQHVQLSAGVFVNKGSINPIRMNVNNITLRGVGPGPGGVIAEAQSGIPAPACAASTCTIIYNADWNAGGINPVIVVGGNDQLGNTFANLGDEVALAVDAPQGAMSVTLASGPPANATWAVGNLVFINSLVCNLSTGANVWPNASTPELFCGGINHAAGGSPTGDPWYYYGITHRYMQQQLKIASVNTTTHVVTFTTPLAVAYTVAQSSELASWSSGNFTAIGVEEMYLYGGSNGSGNVTVHLCDGCWVKHIESHFSNGGDHLVHCFHCEYRDNYNHETQCYQNVSSGGACYLLTIDESSNTLVENNIVWNGEKVDVMRGGGGGNVLAYNYMDDGFNTADQVTAESGVNGGHYVAEHHDLFEGNQVWRYSGDSVWGNSIYLTAYRNWLTGQRGCRGWLATFLNPSGWPCGDYWNRTTVTLQQNQWWHNIVGNVLGFSGQAATLVNGPAQGTSFISTQTGVRYYDNTILQEAMGTSTANNDNLTMYQLGQDQAGSGNPDIVTGDQNLYQKTNIQGNFDWFTSSQIWYSTFGQIGTSSTGSPRRLLSSLYLPGNGASPPSFFSSSSYCPCVWPWVDPSTGATHTLPAKARFDAGTPNIL